MMMRPGTPPLFSGRPGRFEQGIALILVLWVITLLTVIAGSFVYGARSTALIAGNLVSIAKARALADAGTHRGLYELLKPTSDAERWKADGRERVFSLEDAEIRLVMRDETAKIDLNSASDALLKGLLLSVGMDEERANQILDAILDWRDADDLVHPQGAERDRYEAMGLPVIPANAPFQAVDELQHVMGMTPDVFRKLAGALTVFSRQPGINSTLASRQVLLALPGATEENVDAYLAQREEMLIIGQTPLPFPQATGFETGAAAQVYNLRSIAKAPDGTQFVREAVAKVAQDPKQPFIFLLWQEGRP
jgi:general secretion pathway protein K